MGGGKRPGAPNYEQSQQGIEQGARWQNVASNPNMTGPFGSVTSSQGANGQWTLNSSLAAPLQKAAGQDMSTLAGQGPLNLMQFGNVGTGDSARDQAINSAYAQAASRLDPQWSQRQEQERAMLANQGLDPNSQAYQTEMGNFGRDRNDAYTSAMANAISQGTETGNSVFQNNLAANQFKAGLAGEQYNQPLQQLQALQGFTPQDHFNADNSTLQGANDSANYGLKAHQQQNADYNAAHSGLANTIKGVGKVAAKVAPIVAAALL